MQTSLELERDAFDQWVSRALTVAVGNVRPSEQVWQRIVHHVVNPGAGRAAVQDTGENRSLGLGIEGGDV